MLLLLLLARKNGGQEKNEEEGGTDVLRNHRRSPCRSADEEEEDITTTNTTDDTGDHDDRCSSEQEEEDQEGENDSEGDDDERFGEDETSDRDDVCEDPEYDDDSSSDEGMWMRLPVDDDDDGDDSFFSSSEEEDGGPEFGQRDAEHLVEYLEHGGEEDYLLLNPWASWTHQNRPPDNWYSNIPVRENESFHHVLDAAEHDLHTTHVVLDIGAVAGGFAVCRINEVLRCWRNLQHLEIECGVVHSLDDMECNDELLTRFLERSNTASSSLQSLQLWAIGSPSLWTELTTKLGPSLSTLTLADQVRGEPLQTNPPTATELQQAIASSYPLWTSLRTIELHLGPAATSVTPLQGLAKIPNLTELRFHMSSSADQSAATVVEDIAQCIPTCKNLRKLILDASSLDRPLNVCSVVASAALSQSLEDMKLHHVDLVPSQIQSIPLNRTLHTLTLVRYGTLEASACHILSHFHGLTVLRMNFTNLGSPPLSHGMHRSPVPWELLLRQHSQLHTLEYADPTDVVGSTETDPIERDEVLATILSSLQNHHSSLRHTSLAIRGTQARTEDGPLHKLPALLQYSQGTLRLQLSSLSEADVVALSCGMEKTHPALRELHIIVRTAIPYSGLAAMFRALQTNTSLQHLDLQCDCTRGNGPHLADLENDLKTLLATNSALTTLRVRLHPDWGSLFGLDVEKRLLNSLRIGLTTNRSLLELHFPLKSCIFPAQAERLFDMLELNTSLRRFEGITFALSPDQQRMERYLVLNQRGRYLLFDQKGSERRGAIPLGLWPIVLAPLARAAPGAESGDGSNLDALFFFLQHLPQTVFRRGTARACPRPADSE